MEDRLGGFARAQALQSQARVSGKAAKIPNQTCSDYSEVSRLVEKMHKDLSKPRKTPGYSSSEHTNCSSPAPKEDPPANSSKGEEQTVNACIHAHAHAQASNDDNDDETRPSLTPLRGNGKRKSPLVRLSEAASSVRSTDSSSPPTKRWKSSRMSHVGALSYDQKTPHPMDGCVH